MAGGVGARPAQPDQPISVGTDAGAGVALSNAELAQIVTTASGAVTFGDPAQTGTITFAAAAPATTPGAGVIVVQAAAGPGAIVLDSTNGTALAAGSGAVHLSAGGGGIAVTGANTSLASSGQVSLDTAGGIGVSGHRVLFDATATPSAVSVGTTTAPAGGVYLGGLGALTLGDARTRTAPLDASAAADLPAAGALSAGDVTLTASALTVNAAGSVMAGSDLAVRADTLTLLGTLSAGSSGIVTVKPRTASR